MRQLKHGAPLSRDAALQLRSLAGRSAEAARKFKQLIRQHQFNEGLAQAVTEEKLNVVPGIG